MKLIPRHSSMGKEDYDVGSIAWTFQGRHPDVPLREVFPTPPHPDIPFDFPAVQRAMIFHVRCQIATRPIPEGNKS
jgi:hypothetical protein